MSISRLKETFRLLQQALEVLPWMFSEEGAQAGKDICDRLICPQKACVKNRAKQENNVETASRMGGI